MAFGFLKRLVERFTGKPVDWDDVEEALIRSDIGVQMTGRILAALREGGKGLTEETVMTVAREEVLKILPRDQAMLRPFPSKPKVVMMVGVNGTGKTTTTAKLAGLLKRKGHSVMIAAADTFRAAAVEQVEIWAERLGCDLIKGPYNADPAAVCHDAYQAAAARGVEFLICDTAGRLHTKVNLMSELAKVKRSLAKVDAESPHETLLVVDATTGVNALVQAREFAAAAGLTGVVVTKLDGSGKGGCVVAIQQELGIPTRFIGTGERLEDIAFFEARPFVDQMM
jgi:fused signal recognition particle receptor